MRKGDIPLFVVRQRRVILDSDISVHASEDSAIGEAEALNIASGSDRYYVKPAVVLAYRYV